MQPQTKAPEELGGIAEKKERVEALETKLEEVKTKPSSKSHTRQVRKLKERIREAKLKVEMASATRDYNLGTSLKSYIDPRAFVNWANKVSYDWKKYYQKTLQRKYAWADDTSKQCPKQSDN